MRQQRLCAARDKAKPGRHDLLQCKLEFLLYREPGELTSALDHSAMTSGVPGPLQSECDRPCGEAVGFCELTRRKIYRPAWIIALLRESDVTLGPGGIAVEASVAEEAEQPQQLDVKPLIGIGLLRPRCRALLPSPIPQQDLLETDQWVAANISLSV